MKPDVVDGLGGVGLLWLPVCCFCDAAAPVAKRVSDAAKDIVQNLKTYAKK